VVAFARGDAVATVVPRFVIRLAGDWRDTQVALPAGRWHNTLTGEDVEGGAQPVADLLRRFPVALLRRDNGLH
jgi:(1->4)-alpha-D-glucan 1-alpha-D-glucosylmutase